MKVIMSLKQKIQDHYQVIIVLLLLALLIKLNSFDTNNNQKIIELMDTQESYLAEISNQLKEINDKLDSIDSDVSSLRIWLT